MLGGLLLIMGVDMAAAGGFGDSWYYFLISFLAFAMYFFRRRMRINSK